MTILPGTGARVNTPPATMSDALASGIALRATRLYEDYRRIEPVAVGVFRVLCPSNPAYVPKTVRIVSSSTNRSGLPTAVRPMGYGCDCKCFSRWRICKHGEGLYTLIEAQIDEYARRQKALPLLPLDACTRRLLHLGGNPHLLTNHGLRIEYANALDAAMWDLRAAWTHTQHPDAAEGALNGKLQGYVPEGGSK